MEIPEGVYFRLPLRVYSGSTFVGPTGLRLPGVTSSGQPIFKMMVAGASLELATGGLAIHCSIPLNYHAIHLSVLHIVTNTSKYCLK